MALRLQWGTQHSLVYTQIGPEQGAGVLHLEKPNGDQDVLFGCLPRGMTSRTLEQSWQEQGSKWHDLFVFNIEPHFIALRAIWLPDGWCILWTVVHYDAKPHDACVIVQMRRGEWPEETIRAALAAT